MWHVLKLSILKHTFIGNLPLDVFKLKKQRKFNFVRYYGVFLQSIKVSGTWFIRKIASIESVARCENFDTESDEFKHCNSKTDAS